MAVAILLAFGALGACGGGKAKDAPSDASVGDPPSDAAPPDAMVGDAGSIVESWTLPGSGDVAGGTVSMDVEIGNAIEPAVLRGGTFTLEVGGTPAGSSP